MTCKTKISRRIIAILILCLLGCSKASDDEIYLNLSIEDDGSPQILLKTNALYMYDLDGYTSTPVVIRNIDPNEIALSVDDQEVATIAWKAPDTFVNYYSPANQYVAELRIYPHREGKTNAHIKYGNLEQTVRIRVKTKLLIQAPSAISIKKDEQCLFPLTLHGFNNYWLQITNSNYDVLQYEYDDVNAMVKVTGMAEGEATLKYIYDYAHAETTVSVLPVD